MMNDIVATLLSVIGTGVATFVITRYTMKKNVPIDNLKIAYSRVYFPLNKLLKENQNEKTVSEPQPS